MPKKICAHVFIGTDIDVVNVERGNNLYINLKPYIFCVSMVNYIKWIYLDKTPNNMLSNT